MKIFLSYARKDLDNGPYVEKLINWISAGGHQVWWDRKLLNGDKWQEEILQQIRECDAFVYALSPTSISSQWCTWEFVEAGNSRKRIISVVISPIEDTEWDRAGTGKIIRQFQYEDLTQAENELQLVDKIANVLGTLTKLEDDKEVEVPSDLSVKPPRYPDLPLSALVGMGFGLGAVLAWLAAHAGDAADIAGDVIDAI